MMVDTKTQDTLKTAVNTVMEDNESLTDGDVNIQKTIILK
jgi:hypothetical protein